MCHVMDKGEFKMEDFSQKVNELRVSEWVSKSDHVCVMECMTEGKSRVRLSQDELVYG